MLSRRNFLVYLGSGSLALLRQRSALGAVKFPLIRAKGAPPRGFSPVSPSREDLLVLPKGVTYQVLASYGDGLGTTGSSGEETFGYDNDFLAYFPIDQLSGGNSDKEGLLWVNHESINPRLIHGAQFRSGAPKSRAQIQKEKLAVGGSIIRVARKGNRWERVKDSRFTRRFNALYPEMKISGPVGKILDSATGTLANCSGGRTPWHTVLSCEENYQDFNPSDKPSQHQWATWADTKIREEHYGWVVEIDPFGELPPIKLSALGRFCHENVATRVGPSGHFIAYMGDDSADQYLYKFVSREKFDAKASRAKNRELLSNGILYAANFEKGAWLPLDPKESPELKEVGFRDLAQVLLNPRKAAKALGATPLDRPEDCEIHPKDGSVYIALTNGFDHGNYYGQIVRLVEKNDKPEGRQFQYELFLAGGPQSGLASPDNLLFDRDGNLWVTCDIRHETLASPSHATFGNNGLFVVPTEGASMGEAFQFASGPVGAELTGAAFDPSEKTLFLSVQHPGETSESINHLTSHWPEGGKSIPKPSVVAITGLQ